MANTTTTSSPQTTTKSTTLRINILYASPPDSNSGDDASESYASRASEIFLKSDNSNNHNNNNNATKIAVGYIGPLVVNEWYSGENDGGLLPWYITHDNDHSNNNNNGNVNIIDVTMFLISCTADGSVNRSVRQVTKKLKKYSTQSTNETSRTTSIAATHNYVGLLGHARCDNSAKQMTDTIFGTGRRFQKALEQCYDLGRPQMETQVELVGPEQDFDPWVASIIGELLLIGSGA